MKLKSLLYLSLAAIGMISLASCSDDDDDSPAATDGNIPTAVMTAFKAKFPTVETKDVDWDTEGKYTVADFKMINGLEDLEAWFNTQSGDWAMTETDYGQDLFLIPASLNAAFYASPYKSWDPGEIKSYEYPDSTRDVYIFEAVKTGEPKTDVYFTPKGGYLKGVQHTDADITPDTVLR